MKTNPTNGNKLHRVWQMPKRKGQGRIEITIIRVSHSNFWYDKAANNQAYWQAENFPRQRPYFCPEVNVRDGNVILAALDPQQPEYLQDAIGFLLL